MSILFVLTVCLFDAVRSQGRARIAIILHDTFRSYAVVWCLPPLAGWDFEYIAPCHSEPVAADAKVVLARHLAIEEP